jgi:hypothetical protein
MCKEKSMARQEVKTEGSLSFIKAKDLNDAGTTGVILRGTYLGAVPNNYNPEKSDFKFESVEDGSTVVINGAGNLGSLMGQVEAGSLLEIEYHGMEPMVSGKFKGTPAHQFKVFLDV